MEKGNSEKVFSTKRKNQRKYKMYFTPKDIYMDHYPYKDQDEKKYVSSQQFNKIIQTWAELSLEELIEYGKTELPWDLGQLTIKKAKTKKKPIDWREYRKTGQLKTIDNTHTDDYVIKCMWEKRPHIGINKLYVFKITRNASAKLSKYVRENIFAINKYDLI